MALVIDDRVRETTTVTGTNDATLLGAVTGFQAFSVIGNGNTTYYTISDQSGGNWEVGIGTFSSIGPTLARTTVLSSSNGGAKVSFPAGTKDVFVTYPAEKSVNLDESNYVIAGGSSDIGLNGNLTFNGSTRRIIGDFSSVTATTAVAFQSSTTNGNTQLVLIPNGTSTNTGINFYSNSADITNSSRGLIRIDTAGPDFKIDSTRTGTGTYLPITFLTSGLERMRIDTVGNVGINAVPASGFPLDVVSAATDAVTIRLRATAATTTKSATLSLSTQAGRDFRLVSQHDASTPYALISADPALTGGLRFNTNGAERMRLDASGNLLLGSSTSPSVTTTAGLMSVAGVGIYPWLSNTGSTNTTQYSGLQYYNPTVFSGDNGATAVTFNAISANPQISNTGAGGSNRVQLLSVASNPVIISSGASANINVQAGLFNTTRANTNDLSSNSSNVITGSQSIAGHATTLPSTALSGSLTANSNSVSILSGSATNAFAVLGTINVANTTSSQATTVTAAHNFIANGFSVGAASGGPGTVTNGYAFAANGPVVAATGTLTNYYGLFLGSKTGTIANYYGVYQNDATAINFFNGNVGVGTPAPGTKIDVLTSANSGIRVSDGTQYGIMYASGLGGIAVGTTSNHPYIFLANNTERMRISSDGYVLIGTTSNATNAQLQVNNAVSVKQGDVYGLLGGDPSGSASPTTYYGMFYNGTANAVQIEALSGGVAWRNVCLAVRGGNVGIGTSSPIAKLSIVSATDNTTALTIAGGSSVTRDAGVSLAFQYNATAGQFFASIKSSFDTTGTAASGNLAFFTRTAEVLTEKMRIDSAGNVSIGTTAALSAVSDRRYLVIRGVGTDAGGGAGILQLQTNSAGSTSPNCGNIEWNLPDNTSSSSTRVAFISAGAEGATANNRGSNMIFATKTDGASSAGVERMRINGAGDIGIGTSVPNIYSQGASFKYLTVSNTTATQYSLFTLAGGAGGGGEIDFGNQTIRQAVIASIDGSALTFYTNSTNSGAAVAERMRIDSAGNLLVGTSAGADFKLRVTRSGNFGLAVLTNADTSGITYDQFQVTVGQAGASTYFFTRMYASAGAATQFGVRGDGVIFAQNTTVQAISDVRTKENITNATDGLDVVNALRPVRFDFKEGFGNEKKNQLGFIAQEIEQVFPDAVDIWGESDDPKNPYKSVGTTALIPVLVKAIQEQQKMIDQLTTRLNALEGK